MIIGPSRVGKTVWARSLGEHIYWNGYYDLASLDTNAKYLVMDDIPWERVPNKKCFFGGQKEFIMTDKYKEKTVIKWGKPSIYLCNPDEDPRRVGGHKGSSMDYTQLDWYSKNSLFVEVDDTPWY